MFKIFILIFTSKIISESVQDMYEKISGEAEQGILQNALLNDFGNNIENFIYALENSGLDLIGQ